MAQSIWAVRGRINRFRLTLSGQLRLQLNRRAFLAGLPPPFPPP
jgi:hypothetical protein